MNERIFKKIKDLGISLSDEDLKQIIHNIANECVSVIELIDTYEDDKKFLAGFNSAKNAGARLIKLKFDIG